jgi:cytochrome oxidase Cu insertion factor (SCO1/SenC/PrrC family)
MKPFVASRRRGGLILLGIAALFLTGIAVSYALIESGWHSTATKNYGELVEPVRPINDVALVDVDSQPVAFATYRGKWTLLYFGSADCLKPCTDNLYKMRQITAAQGREAHRVQRVFVVTDAAARDWLRYTLVDYPGTDALFGNVDAIREWAMQFRVAAGSPLKGLHRIYVIDPRGDFMMSYPSDADPRRMNEDLTLLLRASHIG